VGNTTNLAARLQALTRERAGYVCANFVRNEVVAIRGRSDRRDVFTLPLAKATSA